MGCDIHMLAEVRKNGKWEAVTEKVFPNPWYWPGSRDRYSDKFTSDPCDMRNYRLFAILADVRNNYGIKPFQEPRGVPLDASKDWLREVEDWDTDMHSTSYYTLRELQDAPWDSTFTYETQTTPEAAAEFWETGEWPSITFASSTAPSATVVKEFSYKEAAGFFYTSTIPALAKLGSPDDVRVVFGFDN